MSVQDYVDSLYETVKHRSHAGEELWGHNARFTYAGAPMYNYLDGGCANGWHQQTSSLYQGGAWHRQGVEQLRGKNVGGPFFTRKVLLRGVGAYPHYRLLRTYDGSRPSFFYEGYLFPSQQVRDIARKIFLNELDKHVVWTSSNAMDKTSLRQKGEQIMLSVVPTTAPANAVVSVGELFTEGKLFSTPGKSLLDQNPGGEFLNTQFGILPVVSDAKAFKQAASEFTDIMRQYKKDSGKIVRRKAGPYTVTDETTQATYNGITPATPRGDVLSAYLASSSKLVVTKHTLRKVWYSGAFEYLIPRDLSRLEELMFEWNRAYGIVPDPADIWNLLPFTWLADWQTNSGNALRHMFLQASEGATQRYGYVMCHTVVKTTYVWYGNLCMNDAFVPHTITAEVREDIKQRERVLPFGTTYTGNDLSVRQLAILGALGIAK